MWTGRVFPICRFPTSRGLVSRRTVILVLMAVFLYQGMGIFYKVLTLQLVRMQPAPAAAGKAQAAAFPLVNRRTPTGSSPERNLFGTTTKAVAEKQTAAAPVQQDVALLIDLKGTVAGGAKYGFAIIEEKGTKKQRLVKAGDLVAGAKVIRIKRNAIDLLVNDQERTLKIVETKEGPIVPPPPGVPAPTAVAGRVARYDRHQPERDRRGAPGHGEPAQAGADPALLRRRGPRRFHNQQHQAGEPLPEDGDRRRRYHPGGEQPEDPDGG